MTATGYACARCGGPVDALPWCATCGDKVLAYADPGVPILASPEQRAAIRYLYRHHGLHGTPWCLADLSARLGRTVTDYRQVTADEYASVLPSLREWSYGL